MKIEKGPFLRNIDRIFAKIQRRPETVEQGLRVTPLESVVGKIPAQFPAAQRQEFSISFNMLYR